MEDPTDLIRGPSPRPGVLATRYPGWGGSLTANLPGRKNKREEGKV